MPQSPRIASSRTISTILLLILAILWSTSLSWRIIYTSDTCRLILTDGCIVTWIGPSPYESLRGWIVNRPLEWTPARNAHVPILLPGVQQAWPYRVDALHVPLTPLLFALLAFRFARPTWRRMSRLAGDTAGMCFVCTSIASVPIVQAAKNDSHSAAGLLIALIIASISAMLGFQCARRIAAFVRRQPEGHCQNCGYDLTGNVSGVCSECGTSVPSGSAADLCDYSGRMIDARITNR